MSYDLSVWVGERPEDDASAGETYEELMDILDQEFDGDAMRPPSPEIDAYVAALLDRWPDITGQVGEDSPWADGPLIGNASGDLIYFSMVWSRAEEASEVAAEIASAQGLVCYDPQLERLRPFVDAPRRRRWLRRR